MTANRPLDPRGMNMNQAARMSNPIITQLGIKPSGQAQAPVLLRARAVKRGCTR